MTLSHLFSHGNHNNLTNEYVPDHIHLDNFKPVSHSNTLTHFGTSMVTTHNLPLTTQIVHLPNPNPIGLRGVTDDHRSLNANPTGIHLVDDTDMLDTAQLEDLDVIPKGFSPIENKDILVDTSQLEVEIGTSLDVA